jgi:phage terminase large subunit-like protein
LTRKKFEHVTRAKAYARAVVRGKKPAGRYLTLSCNRFLNDLQRKDLKFDPQKANRACKFIECLPHVKGRWARDAGKIKLEPWQSWVICNLFGFVASDGLRRFREAYLRVARKNTKSTMGAAIGLYCLVEDNEHGAEVYSGATSEVQAWEVFGPARRMAQRHAGFIERYGVEIHAKSLAQPETGSSFKPLIGSPGDGASPSCAIIDEFHEHTSWDLYNAMDTGMGAREQPLKVIITTAGDDIASPCFEKDGEIQHLLEGTFTDDTIFGVIFSADTEDDWQSVAAMKKANPNLGVSVARSYLNAQLAKAQRSPAAQAAYRTKNLNQWVNSGSAFLNSLDWAACGDARLRLDDFVGRPCIFALDLATRIDFVALLRVFFERREDGNLEYWWFPRFWLPERQVTEDMTGQFKRWVAAGQLEVHADDEIDFAMLRNEIEAEADRFNPYEIAFDPWRAAGIEQEMSNKGYTMVRIAQTIAQFTDPMNELEAAVMGKTRRLHHPNNMVLNWMASNLSAKEINNNKKPIRTHPKRKIDGMVAGIMGINRAMQSEHGGLSEWLKSIGPKK